MRSLTHEVESRKGLPKEILAGAPPRTDELLLRGEQILRHSPTLLARRAFPDLTAAAAEQATAIYQYLKFSDDGLELTSGDIDGHDGQVNRLGGFQSGGVSRG